MSAGNSKLGFKLILGLGATGLSCVRFFDRTNQSFRIMDTRLKPPALSCYLSQFPQDRLRLGGFDEHWLNDAQEIVMSPGLSLDNKLLLKYREKIVSDIDIFQRQTQTPIIGITGSNGKSTVTALLTAIMCRSGVNAALGGNYGLPVLDMLLHVPDAQCYVVELSSFQLEITKLLTLKAAVILNITSDHMDRYQTFEDYADAKRRIYHNCEYAVVNMDDRWIWQSLSLPAKYTFSLYHDAADFYLKKDQNQLLMMHGKHKVMPVADLKLRGLHNVQNALAALALGHSMNTPLSAMMLGLRTFQGLPHRCQFVRTVYQVDWYNDSKATNIASSMATIQGLGEMYQRRNIILIAGGQGKGADFSLLNNIINKYVKQTILIGEDAEKIADALTAAGQIIDAASLDQAVLYAAKQAKAGDVVLLAPACASFDQFKDFEDRGQQFIKAVLAL
jgi:UDP-N-acetylmuramoylalanine--D-glutamate ligase